MLANTQTALTSKGSLRAGRIISALPILFLLFDSATKLIKIDPVVESFAQLGYPDSVARGLGLLELICTVLYAIPRTSILGAILLTGLLGGAMATHLRVGDPWLTHVFFSLYLGVPLWIGLFLRDERLRALIPLRQPARG